MPHDDHIPALPDGADEILALLYHGEPIAKRGIADALHISAPTLNARLSTLEDAGLIVAAGHRQSTGGRRALTYAFNYRRHCAIGVTIRSTEIVCIAVDLDGVTIDERHTTIAAHADVTFYGRAARIIDDFAEQVAAAGTPPLGVGLAVPTHINTANSLDYAAIAERITLPVTATERYCAYALAELRARPALRDAVCLFLGNHIGSAVLQDGRPHTGAVEHMPLDPDGPRCECGNAGCLNVYCSSANLTEEGESLPGFFGVLEQGEIHHRDRMRDWLHSLAHAIVDIRAVFAADVLLCGPIAGFLDDAEIAHLDRLVAGHPDASRTAAGDDGGTAAPRITRGLCDVYQDADGAAYAIVRDHLRALALPC